MSLFRNIALYARSRSERRDAQKVLHQFAAWKQEVEQLPFIGRTGRKKLAVVRLDDIGDYLLFRNFLFAWQSSTRFADYKLTLIGNAVWKPVFERYDAAAVDHTIWLDKSRYFSDDQYRLQFWQEVRSAGFSIVVCPSRTRPLLLDDMVAEAAAAEQRIGCANSFAIKQWNELSDAGYTELFASTAQQHEFYFNRAFAEYATGLDLSGLNLNLSAPSQSEGAFVVCFIGASAGSKTWPVSYWINLVKLLQQQGYTPLLAGGKNEIPVAEQIIAAAKVSSVVGQTNLVETLEKIAQSVAVITGDTMAAHAAVAFQKPTVILANGVNAARFVAYKAAGFSAVKTIYTREYEASSKGPSYKAVSRDMHSIQPAQVLSELQSLLG
ncbi:MAG TPA: glycosyltransferase family 9 protein [Chitinophagaceae bacterium]|nr:glycosyltransferase family 9 protein [Chitinophagaceae bacterium]